MRISGYILSTISAYYKYTVAAVPEHTVVASVSPVRTLVRPVAPAYLKLTFPRPIPPSPPSPPRPVYNPSDLPPLEQSGPSAQALNHWAWTLWRELFESIPASLIIGFILLALLCRWYSLLLSRLTQRPVSVLESGSGMIGVSGGSPVRRTGSGGGRRSLSSPLAQGMVDENPNSKRSSFLVSVGSGENGDREEKRPEVMPLSVSKSNSGVIGTSDGSPERITGNGIEGTPSSPRMVDEKSNSMDIETGKPLSERWRMEASERPNGKGTQQAAPNRKWVDGTDGTDQIIRAESGSSVISIGDYRSVGESEDGDEGDEEDGDWDREERDEERDSTTQQVAHNRKWMDGRDGTDRTVRAESGSSVASIGDYRTVGESEEGFEEGAEEEGDEDRKEQDEEQDWTAQQQTTMARVRATQNTDTDTMSSSSSAWSNTSNCRPSTSPPDLPSDPNLYKAYLCHVLSIKSADVIDLTGYIDRDRNRFIAAGGFGDVWEASWKGLDKNPHICIPQVLPRIVVKLVRLPPIRNKKDKRKRYKRMKRELQLWSKLNHPHILPLIGIACIHGDANLPALISPWMENGNVKRFLKKNPSFPASRFLKDIIKGLHYLHTFDPVIVHGDIKGANVLINHRKEAYLSDFGLSRLEVDNTLWRTTATRAGGTLHWMAPELIQGDAIRPTIATDVYAFGMTCYEILSRGLPFAVANDATVISKVIEGQRPERIKSCHSDEIWSIITRCWTQEPENRPSTEETLTLVLQHDTLSNL